MAGIYIHIPFCKKACHYCNFHFSTQTQHIEEFTQALVAEIKLQKNYLTAPIETLYFGGGTPSLLKKDELEVIVQAIQAHFNLAAHFEFTIEANPDDINPSIAADWLALGVNRLSMGIQSFQAASLAWMNRAHTVEQSHQAIKIVQAAGFKDISADLIYGTPHLSDENLMADIETLVQYKVNHISCYALTVEEKTALFSMIAKKQIEDIDARKQARHFEIIMDALTAAGYEHYEISNFAMPNCKSKHNSNYWNQVPYLGLGPAAHSYNGAQRQWNVANNALYFQSIKNNLVPFELENLSLTQKFNEYMMISLRKSEGFSTDYIQAVFGEKYATNTLSIVPKYIAMGQLETTEKGYTLTKEAKFFADGIASDFFWINE
ncbi:MAG: radical SAM family heme chaperone HemW [Sediminibacterium sp.]|jgi:oxygen-independent coproporphyrinogen-3 oxidase|nr:MAG: radical SAM family heme chaperone HemW [Sediminibacterium sp.]